MKGGQLIAIRYSGIRYTKDIDFSTDKKYQVFDLETFINEFEKQLVISVESLEDAPAKSLILWCGQDARTTI